MHRFYNVALGDRYTKKLLATFKGSVPDEVSAKCAAVRRAFPQKISYQERKALLQKIKYGTTTPGVDLARFEFGVWDTDSQSA